MRDCKTGHVQGFRANSPGMAMRPVVITVLCLWAARVVSAARLGEHALPLRATAIEPQQDQNALSMGTGYRVLVELFKMSRCPDALRVEGYFEPIVQQLKDIIQVKFHYVATIENPQDGVVCKHGQPECDGDKQQLCVQKYAGNGADNYDVLWQFVRCQGAQPDAIGDLPLVEECLNKTVTDSKVQEKMRRCYTGNMGEGLLRGDVERVKAMGVTKSCTIYINKKKRCIHDGNTWYECDGGHEQQDFVASICNAYLAKTGHWPAVCGPTLTASDQ